MIGIASMMPMKIFVRILDKTVDAEDRSEAE